MQNHGFLPPTSTQDRYGVGMPWWRGKRPPTEPAGRNRNRIAVVKVLYIEDNDDDVYMLKMRLELLGNFEVLTAEDGETGSEVAAAEQPDIILMDLEMPVVDGWEAARRLKGNRQTQDIVLDGRK